MVRWYNNRYLTIRLALKPGNRDKKMPTSKPPIVVFSVSDQTGHYWINTAIAIGSMLRYASQAPRIFVMHDGTLSAEAHKVFGELARRFGAELTLLKIDLPGRLLNLKLGHYTTASCYRLLIPKVFAAESQVLYLDSDIVFHGLNVCEYFSEGLSCPEVSAVKDPFIGEGQSHLHQLHALGLDSDHYFNSGALLINPSKAPHNLLESFTTWLRGQSSQVHPDQDFLNITFRDRWTEIDEKFNFQVSVYRERFFLEASEYKGKMLHFAGKVKPMGHLAPGLLPWYGNLDYFPEIHTYIPHSTIRYLQRVPERPNTVRRIPC
jgi:lipopolysaccharide biosynthesis glycosyltransferase